MFRAVFPARCVIEPTFYKLLTSTRAAAMHPVVIIDMEVHMHRSFTSLRSLAVGLVLATAAAGGSGCSSMKGDTIKEAKAEPIGALDDGARAARIASLRAKGPAGLQEALAEYDAVAASSETSKTQLARMRDFVDRVAAQRDAWASRLYWYTDLEEAKAAAKASGKPILSLRMLGDLRDALSCANSRLFRMALYSNAAVQKAMREGFVLHWSSERSVPQITVDYGDGRVVKRTITGNSIHYVLDAQGRPIDGIPGLYGPAAFVQALARVHDLARSTAKLDDDSYRRKVIAYHEAETKRLETEWRAELKTAGIPDEQAKGAFLPRPAPALFMGGPPALFVGEMTVGKAAIERPMIHALQPQLVLDGNPLGAWPWIAIAAHHQTDAKMDDASRALVATQRPLDWSTDDPKPLTKEALDYRISEFERAMSLETVRNEYALHGAIHVWFEGTLGMKDGDRGFDGLNTWVYQSVFLTPKQDAWLGLAQLDVLSGLPDDGLTIAKQ